MRLILLLIVVLSSLSSLSYAELSSEDAIRVSINRTFPDIDVSKIKESEIKGIYEVLLGADLVYVSADGRFVFQGDLIDLKYKRNISEDKRENVRKDILAAIPAKDYIEYAPENRKHTVYVFTDIDCGYCRKLHQDMTELNRRGLAVRYLAFPRAGMGSKTDKQMQSVWCAHNRNKAMNEAKQGMRVSPASCDNPVEQQYVLGQDIGVRGTPAIYTQRGQALPGYLPPDRLLQALAAQ
jgi:thiol:disulfide interchange protein DsbC